MAFSGSPQTEDRIVVNTKRLKVSFLSLMGPGVHESCKAYVFDKQVVIY